MKALTCVGVREWGGQRSSGLVDQYLVALEISDDSFIPGAGLWALPRRYKALAFAWALG